MTVKRAAFFLLVAVLLWLDPAHAANPTAGPPGLYEQLYSIRVNTQLVSEGSIILIDAHGQLYASVEDLQRWRFVNVDKRATVIRYKGGRYVGLSAYAAIRVSVDSKDQELDITAAPQDFAQTDVQLGESVTQKVLDRQPGVYLNYALHGDTAAASTLLNSFLELGISDRNGGAFTTSFLAQDVLKQRRGVRLDTVWQLDNPDKHRSLHIGDFVTEPASLGIPVRFAGISVATDFSTEPHFITFPTASARGVAALPSVVDVFINGYKTGSALVPAGPYDVGAIAGTSGTNQAQLVVRDITGTAHVVTLSFYNTPDLLKSGLSSYAYEAGTERLNYGIDSAAYGPSFVQATWRHGYSDKFTAETHLEATSSFQDYGLAGTILLNAAGTLNAGFMQSVGMAGAGQLAQLGYDYRSPRLSAFVQAQAAGRGFREIGYDALTGGLRSLWQSGLSFTLPRGDQISFTSINRRLWAGTTQQFVKLEFARNLRHGNLIFSYALPLPANEQPGLASATLVTSFGERGSVATSSSVQQGKISQDLALQLSLPQSGIGDAIDFREHTGAFKSFYAQGTHQTQRSSESLALLDSNDRADLSADVSGSVIFLDNKTLPARQVMEGYGVVELPGYAGIDVLLNNQKVGETDGRGDFVLPHLVPYDANLISIDPVKLPISANIANLDSVAVPSRGGAVIVHFPTRSPGGVLIAVFGSDGMPLPAGTLVRQGSESWPIAEDGQAYLAGIHSGKQRFTSLHGSVSCEFDVTVPSDVQSMPNLGRFHCVDAVLSR